MDAQEITTVTSNPAAERALVGTALAYPASYDDANASPADFELPLARAAWEAIGALRESGTDVSPVTVLEAARTRSGAIPRDAVVTLLDWAGSAMHSAAAKDLAAVVRKTALARRLVGLCGETLARLKAADADVEATLGDHRSACAQLESGADDEPQHVPTELAKALDEIEARCAKPNEAAIQTGVREFDKTIGGLRPSRQIVIAARPGEGKSALGVQFCVHAALSQGIPALIFSLEMTLQEQVERMLAGASEISVSKIGRGQLGFAEFVKMSTGAKRFGNIPLWIYDKPIKVDRLLSTARRWHARHVKPGQKCLVMIDYIGLVQSTSRGATREREVAMISQAGKAFAMQHGATTLMVSQLNRDSEKEQRDPRMADLRESGAIEQDADMIVFPCRNHGEEDNLGTGPARLIVAKNRTGPKGEVAVWWEGRFTRFTDFDAPPPESDFAPTTDPLTGEQ
jgi:replicative DNA helicase